MTTAQQTQKPKDHSASKPKDHSDVLASIEEFYTENTIDVYCPCSGLRLKYKPLSVKQLKEFIELQVSVEKDEFGVLPGLNIVKHINGILSDNCVDADDDLLSMLTVIDRDTIILQLRNNTKSDHEVALVDDETESVDLNELVDNIKHAKFDKKLKARTKIVKYTSGSVKLDLWLPNLIRDNEVNEHFLRKVKPKLLKGKKQVQKDVEKILSSIYFLEMSKYIDTLTVSKNDYDTVLDFNDSTKLFHNLELLEKLPSNVMSEVTAYVNEIKEFRDSLFSYSDSDGKRAVVDIDVALFTGI